MANEKISSQPAKFQRFRRYSYESPGKLKDLEKGFILDGVPMSKLANDEVGRTQPSLNLGIPQYSSLNDPRCKSYFRSKSLKEVSRKKGGKEGNCSPSESVLERFMHNSSAQKYLDDRKRLGAGYTRKLYGGHLTVPTAAPKQGYHGDEGYRRNTPDLRLKRSVFEDKDPFDHQRPLIRRNRIQSAPAIICKLRIKSAKIYHEVPLINKRTMSSLPTSIPTRELSTGPV